ncbi:unnamed protein product [Linum tenue]|uniref:Secreted protein n=1 Tax=Linum tenue TaxID=586396 RepID=A0AAV0J3J6_9ROSI|nr:unnamed protein product [Linum tenue]CAI0404192.1 unnamed protein product [Linum tenue]
MSILTVARPVTSHNCLSLFPLATLAYFAPSAIARVGHRVSDRDRSLRHCPISLRTLLFFICFAKPPDQFQHPISAAAPLKLFYLTH